MYSQFFQSCLRYARREFYIVSKGTVCIYQLYTCTLVSHNEYQSLANAFQFHHLCYWVVIRQWLDCYQSFSLGNINNSPKGNLNTILVPIDLTVNKIHTTDNGIPPTQSHGWPQLIFHSFLVWLVSVYWGIIQSDPAYNSNKTDGNISKSNHFCTIISFLYIMTEYRQK